MDSLSSLDHDRPDDDHPDIEIRCHDACVRWWLIPTGEDCQVIASGAAQIDAGTSEEELQTVRDLMLSGF